MLKPLPCSVMMIPDKNIQTRDAITPKITKLLDVVEVELVVTHISACMCLSSH